MKKRISHKMVALLSVFTLSVGFLTATSFVSVATANPAPYPIIDEWHYGVSANYAYSNYYVKSPNNIGSKSSITNVWGTVKAYSSQKYGWAMSSSPKSWNDVRLNAHWNYFRF